MPQENEKSTIGLTVIKLQGIIDQEHVYEYPQFLLSLRRCLGRTRQVVTFDLDWQYDELWRHEEGKMPKKFDKKKVDQLAEYYGVDPCLLERKYREWIRSNPSNYLKTRDQK